MSGSRCWRTSRFRERFDHFRKLHVFRAQMGFTAIHLRATHLGMATSGQLVKAVADALGIPVATVSLYDRMLSEAGLRTKGGRGRSAAKMTTRDAASLLVATVTSPISGPAIAGAKENFVRYGSLGPVAGYTASSELEKWRLVSMLSKANLFQPSRAQTDGLLRLEPLDLPKLKNLAATHTLIDLIASVFDCLIDGSLDRELETAEDFERPHGISPVIIAFRTPFPLVSVEFQARYWFEVVRYGGAAETENQLRYLQMRFVYLPTLKLIANIFKEPDGSQLNG